MKTVREWGCLGMDLTFRDAVWCVDCGLLVKDWQEGENPRGVHVRRMNSSCRFVRNAIKQGWKEHDDDEE